MRCSVHRTTSVVALFTAVLLALFGLQTALPERAEAAQLTQYGWVRGMNYDPTYDLWSPESMMPSHIRADLVGADLDRIKLAGYNTIRVFSPMLDGNRYDDVLADLDGYGNAFQVILDAARARDLKVMYIVWNHTTIDAGALSQTPPTASDRNDSYSLYRYLNYWVDRFDASYSDVLISWSMDNEPDPQGQSTPMYPTYAAYIKWIYTTMKQVGATVPLSTGYIDAPSWDSDTLTYNDFLEYHFYIWPVSALDAAYGTAARVATDGGKALMITETGIPGGIDGTRYVQPYDEAAFYWQSRNIGYMDWGNRMNAFQGLLNTDNTMNISTKPYSQVKAYKNWSLLGATGYDWTGGDQDGRGDGYWTFFDTALANVKSGTQDKALLYRDLETVYNFARSAVGYYTPSFYERFPYAEFQAESYAANLRKIQGAIDMAYPVIRGTFGRSSALTGFSGTQGANNWSYLYGTPGATTPLTFSNGQWVKPSETFLVADRFGMSHPGTTDQALRRWTAPSNGFVHISGSVKKAVAGGNGVTATISQGTATLQSIALSGTDTTGTTFDRKLWVSAGSTLTFGVGSNGSNTSDATAWTIDVDYVDPVISNLADFSTTQGRTNLRYQLGTTASATDMSLSSGAWQSGDFGTIDRNGFAHPAASGDALWQWTAPYSGRVYLTGTYSKLNPDGSGDGVRVYVAKNTTQLFSRDVGASDDNRYYFDSESVGAVGIDVTAGDKIWIGVNRRSNTTNDGTVVNFRVHYPHRAWSIFTDNADGGSTPVRYDYASNTSTDSPPNDDLSKPMRYIRGTGVGGSTALRSDLAIQRVTLGHTLVGGRGYSYQVAVKPAAETLAGLTIATDQYFHRAGNAYPEIRILATDSSSRQVKVEQIAANSTLHTSDFDDIDTNFKSVLTTRATYALNSSDYDANGYVALRVDFTAPTTTGGTVTGTVYANGRSLGTFTASDPGRRKVGLETAPINLRKYDNPSSFDNLKLVDTTSGTTVFSDRYESADYSGQKQTYEFPEKNWSVLSRLASIDSEIFRKVGGSTVQTLQSATSAASSVANGDVTVTWSDTSTRESGFIIERQAAGSSVWREIWRTGPDSSSARFPVTDGGSYVYRVRAASRNPSAN